MSRRILIVDDNAVTRRLVRISLKPSFDVIEAHDAPSAVEAATLHRPDLILQDMVLPDIGGLELLTRLRAVVGNEVPILAFTGLLAHQIEVRMGTASFDDVVSKPIDPSRLVEIVRGYFPSGTDTGRFTVGAPRRLVLADDDPIQLKLATFRLSRMGFQVFPARDGEEALTIARDKRPDAIVSDVLMPKMDGFELCSRVRSDAVLAATPLLLLTNSYLEERDFELARRVGADAYVVRTPELTELQSLLEKTLAVPNRRTLTPRSPDPSVQAERIARALRQLDRQVGLNATLAQRNAMLSAELAILGGLTTALAEHGDPDTALDTALSACFDAGGISWGVLLICSDEGWKQRVIGLSSDALRAAGPALAQLARTAAEDGAPRTPRTVTVDALPRDEALGGEVLLVPVCHRDEVLGVLLLGAGRGMDAHRVAFAGVVAGQIAQTLALSRTFGSYERAKAEAEARSRLLESILDAIDDPIVVVDPSMRANLWNRAGAGVAERTAAPVEEWAERISLYHSDQRTKVHWEDLPAVRAIRGEPVSTELVSIPGGEHPIRWMNVKARPVRKADGDVEAAVVVVRDVTSEKHTQAQQMFSDRMASLGVLAAGVVHEINNPLGAVTAEIEMALEDTVGHGAHEGLLLAREAARRVRDIVLDLKTLSRGETDDVATLDVVAVIESAVRLSRAQTRARAVVELDLAAVPRIVGNEARLGQVFLNLIVNASHAIQPGNPAANRIVLRTRAVDERVIVEITDTGLGMAPEVRARLFTPFFTTKPVGVGTGLGLSVSQRIVASMGGTIDVDSTPGRGTTFRLSFPVAPSDHVFARDSLAAWSRRVLLAVHEDPLWLQSIRRELRPEYEVECVTRADEALAKLAPGHPFVVVLWQADLPTLSVIELRARLAAGGDEVAAGNRIVALTTGPIADPTLPTMARTSETRTLRALLAALL